VLEGPGRSGAAGAVVIIDDHPIAMHGLEVPLGEAGFAVLPGAAVVEHLSDPPPGAVAVCDLRLPGRSGADAVAYAVERGYKTLATSGVATSEEVLDVVAAGAGGYIAKTAPPHVFVQAVAALAADGLYVSPELARLLLDDATNRPLQRGDIGAFEREALYLLAQGDSPEEVAAALGIGSGRFEALAARIWDAARRRRRENVPSPREAEVIRLAAEGLTHRQLADRLFISTYTVPDLLERVKAKYLASHPGAPRDLRPLAAARLWAKELGYA
jgi:DNA-binding NarL/FixJ family response regulator